MAGRRLGSRIGGGCRSCQGGFLVKSREKCVKMIGGASPRRTPASCSALIAGERGERLATFWMARAGLKMRRD